MVRLVPRETKFFGMFAEVSANLILGARLMVEILHDFKDIPARVQKLKDIEHRGDEMTHAIITKLNQTFITPFDREDIRSLASDLDDILDHLESVAKYLVLFQLDESPEPLRSFARILTSMCGEIDTLRGLIWDMGNRQKIQELMVRISELENEGDSLYFVVISDLYKKGHTEAIEILKWKEVYEGLEEACDRCKDFTHVVGNVVIKSA
jgi:uncharacterized protein